ncbi:MAG TPA: capsular biosynthesis protein [Bacteroidales bacterium]|nr:capsular biosynthesis protein [Bacteroidales bacterium]HOH83196.1 capsular biosynthesis protein [Bacteroidales bacterium]HPB25765.1 capsular biosynthesis protein [Bacteroidales bacterium]HPI31154.1 capsular biosynthesis protein [Bacteroidales bacterium]HQN16611.1 capsular biosynthesis protein [Bacteroidales bacterium]
MAIFDFRHKQKNGPFNYTDFYSTDLHSHLIPGIDDGSPDMDESLKIIAGLSSMGIKKIITTPHISMLYPNTPEKIYEIFTELQREVAARNIEISLEVAAEYMIDENFVEILKNGKLMTFGKNYVLIELSPYNPFPILSDLIFEMQIKGYNIVLAHPERYLYWQYEFSGLEKLKDRELLFQLNILSLTKIYSQDVHKLAVRLIKEGMVDFVGSDTHSMDYIPKMKDVLTGRLFQDLAATGQIKNNLLSD